MRLRRIEVEGLYTLLDDAAAAIIDVRIDPERKTWRAWDSLYEAFVDIPARAEMPLGELLNPDLGLLPIIWDKQGRLKIYSFEQLARVTSFGTNAIEGACCVEMDLIEALKLVDLVSSYRLIISVPRRRVASYLIPRQTINHRHRQLPHLGG